LCYTFAGSDVGTWGYPDKTAHEIWGEEFKLPENVTKEELKRRWNPPYNADDILYVRETWQCWRAHRYEATADIRFRAGGDDVRLQFANGNTDSINRLDYDTFVHKWFSHNGEWKPSLFMPKEAARIWLKVMDVRVERLQEITSEQIGREGVEVEYPHVLNGEEKRYAFSTLWNNTIKKSDLDCYGWNANPWVWVIEFERCEKPEDYLKTDGLRKE
jgi:hypothetical protein